MDATHIDIGRAIDSGPWSLYQKFLLLLGAFCFFIEGLDVQVLGVAIPSLIADWKVPREAFSLVTALGLAGFAVGAALGGYLGDWLGRRAALIGSILIFSVATAWSAQAGGIEELSLMRVIAGLGLGGMIPNGTTLVAEFTPLRYRAFAIAFCMISLSIGGIVSALMASEILPVHGWQGFFIVMGSAGIVFSAVLVFLLPESPRILIRDPARLPALRTLMNRLGQNFSSDAQFADAAPNPKSRVMALLEEPYRYDTLMLLAGSFCLMLGFYTVFNWAPTVLTSSGLTIAEASQAIAAFATGGIAGNVAISSIIRFIGSRVAFLASALAVFAGAMLGLQALTEADPGLGTFVWTFALFGAGLSGFQTGIFALAAHLYPPASRTTGTGATVAIARIGAIVSSWTGVWAYNLGGGQAYFISIGAAVLLAAIFVTLIRNHTTRLH